jgi:predicted glycogen debranching enzyme
MICWIWKDPAGLTSSKTCLRGIGTLRLASTGEHVDLQRVSRMEWLEADGLGGFASGTAVGIRTRRYHALLLTAMTPPTNRVVLVNGYDAWVETPTGLYALSSQRYTPDVIHPDGAQRIESFEADPWPRWTYRLEDGTRIEHEFFVPHGSSMAVLCWRVRDAIGSVALIVRPLFSGRDFHALHHENHVFQFTPKEDRARLIWHVYPGLPRIVAISNGSYRHQPDWYRNFLYTEERARGLDETEDLASPGEFRWDVSAREAVWIVAAEGHAEEPAQRIDAEQYARSLRMAERRRRRKFLTPLHQAADAYIVSTAPRRVTNGLEGQREKNKTGKTIIAGYPWFTDWGRDTFMAMRGLCLAIGRLDIACDILLAWAGTVSEGMVPNRFPDKGGEPEFNSVDASLWYIIAIYEFLQAADTIARPVSPEDRAVLYLAIESILSGYANGTRFDIRLDKDGLLAAGQPGTQLTWMDAKIGEWVVTPRIGKPVEVQALWLNALKIGGRLSDAWSEPFHRGMAAFGSRFWNESSGSLHDVVDCDHRSGVVDASCRPNQIFAVGGLPFPLLEGTRARQVVDVVESRLWTPMGLRSLAPGEPGYVSRYHGGVRERDGAYHQGTAWPWLAGPFIEAWVRVHAHTPDVKKIARERYLDPLLQQTHEAGLGHLSEIADAEPPYTPRGCPFQAWSLGEAMRVLFDVVADDQAVSATQDTMPRTKGRQA